jgi:tetrapyrrole methylase family protein/MazG family protein
MIHLVGLGPGDPQSLPPRAAALLLSDRPVLVRTLRHPVFAAEPLRAARSRFISLDEEYEAGQSFDDTYAAIVERLLRAAENLGEIVYAVPGHPLVGETTVARLLDETRRRGIPTHIVAAPSFVDACLATLGVAITGDLHVVDALALDPAAPAPVAALAPDGPFLLYQVHDRAAASLAKLALMRAGFPDDHPVVLLRAAGVEGQEMVTPLPLFALDRRDDHDHLTSVWVPALAPDARRPGFDSLIRIMARLRDPESGCPWDRKQTHASLRRYLLEEAYEAAEAIDDGDPEALCEELGDVLLQVVFHGQLAAETGDFDTGDICEAICTKLIRRHPHIFGDVKAETSEQVLQNWNAIKAAEKGASATPRSLLDGISRALPALAQAREISERVVRVGFEWPGMAQLLDKVDEEWAELRVELDRGDTGRAADELGDVLFTLVNIGRRIGVDPEEALRRQLERFSRRWRHIEQEASARGVEVATLSLAEMESLWRAAKEQER